MNSFFKKFPRSLRLMMTLILGSLIIVIYTYYHSDVNVQKSAKGSAFKQVVQNSISNSTAAVKIMADRSTSGATAASVTTPSSLNTGSGTKHTEALALYDQGLKLYNQKNYRDALTLFNKALELDPNCYQALNSKGATYAFMGRYTEGIKMVNQAISMQPNYQYGYFNLGITNELAGNWDQAIAAYQTAIKLDSRDEWAYYGIASIYGRQGKIDQVVEYLGKAIAIDPGVKESARKEKDFNPVRNNPKFQKLVQ